jgi:1,4-dihydroxy-2-naphthoyl-CoA hydrolase
VPDLPDLSLDAAPPFLRGARLQVEEATGTRVTGTIAAGPDHHTPWGVVHGGVYTTAVESACSIGASMAVVGRGEYAVGISNQTDFLRPHVAGELRVTATPIHQGRTQQLWLCEIVRADDGKAVARGQLRLQNVPLGAGRSH